MTWLADLDELRRLLAGATPAEWVQMKGGRVFAPWSGDPEDTYVGNVADAYNECDAALIVALRVPLPDRPGA